MDGVMLSDTSIGRLRIDTVVIAKRRVATASSSTRSPLLDDDDDDEVSLLLEDRAECSEELGPVPLGQV